MIERLIRFSTAHPWHVLLAAAVLGLAGEWARRSVPADAVPDLSDPQLSIDISWPRRSATEVRDEVTAVVEAALPGAPGVKAVRGVSMAESGFVHVMIADERALEAARAAVRARLERIRPRLPADARVALGPDASSLGWVFQYALVDRRRRTTVADRRRLQEQLLAPELQALPGVAEVATVAGTRSALNLELDLEALARRGLSVADAVAAARRQVAVLARAEARGEGRPALDTLEGAEIGQGARIARLGEVAHLWNGVRMTMGTATLDGRLEAVGGIVVARRGAHVPAVIAAVQDRLRSLAARLPPTVEVVTTYDRSALVARTGRTLWVALGEEALVVGLVLVLFLGLTPSAGVPVVILPFVVLGTFLAMRISGLSADVMSLGGIALALGLCIDAEIVATESCHAALAAGDPQPTRAARLEALATTTGRVAPLLFVALLIAAISFLPMFALAGEAGRLVRPLAITKTAVVLAGAALAVTLGPALRALALRRPVRDRALLSSLAERIYRPMVLVALQRPAVTALIGALAVLSTVGPASRLGSEFMPEIDEGDLLYMPTTLPGASMHDTEAHLALLTRQLSAIPEVETVFGKAGRAETATDPAPLSMIEANVRLRPRAEWPMVEEPRWFSSWAPWPLRRLLGLAWPERRLETKEELVARLDREVGLVGWSNAFTMPIRGRVEMLTTGVRGAVGIRVSAADPVALDRIGAALEAVLGRVPGTRRVFFERSQGALFIDRRPNPGALAECGVAAVAMDEALDVIANGLEVGAVGEGSSRVPVVVRAKRRREILREIGQLPIACPTTPDRPRPLGELVTLRRREGPSMLRTEEGRLVSYAHLDLVPDREVEAYIRDAQAAIEDAAGRGALVLPAGSRLEWTGQHEVAARTRRRLAVLVPLVLVTVALLLYAVFRSVAQVLIVLATVPFALVGAVWSLYLLDYRLSTAVWIGAVALIGLAVQTGMVMMLYLDEAYLRRRKAGGIETREDVAAAHLEGAVGRLRPKLMTVATMTLGLAPLLWSEGAGAEVMRRVAAPMFGGLFTSAFLTLEILPVLTTWWRAVGLPRSRSRPGESRTR